MSRGLVKAWLPHIDYCAEWVVEQMETFYMRPFEVCVCVCARARVCVRETQRERDRPFEVGRLRTRTGWPFLRREREREGLNLPREREGRNPLAPPITKHLPDDTHRLPSP